MRDVPEDGEEDVDEQVSAAAGDEEDAERRYYFLVSMILTESPRSIRKGAY